MKSRPGGPACRILGSLKNGEALLNLLGIDRARPDQG